MDASSQPAAWLVRISGPRAGQRYRVRGPVTQVGRDPKCDLVTDSEDSAVVSSRHAELLVADDGWRLRDLGSTNGTFLNGERVAEAVLSPGATIRFGASGPEFTFHETEPADLNLTMNVPAPSAEAASREKMVAEAVHKARAARAAGDHGQTMHIMRDMLGSALHRSGRRSRVIIAALALALVLVSAYSVWRIQRLGQLKSEIDDQILRIENQLREGGLTSAEVGALMDRLDRYQRQAERVEDSLLYRLAVEPEPEGFVEREIRALMDEFGAEQYSIPPEFVEQVRRFIERYSTTDTDGVMRTIGSHREEFARMREIFAAQNLPPDLAYMAVVESSFISQSKSRKGAAGFWQFTPATARAYGMKVSGKVDERYDLEKSTEAAGKYIRELILEFGAGSSVMLALAAYNYGPRKVKRAVRRVEDPIKQRNFWYLYRARALPVETRQFVPKIVAAIILGRNLERFGF